MRFRKVFFLIGWAIFCSIGQSQENKEKLNPEQSKAKATYKFVLTTLGEKHPSTLAAMRNLAFVYQSEGNYQKAEPFYLKALQTSKETLGEKHLNSLSSLNDLALLYYDQGKYDLAESLFLSALKELHNPLAYSGLALARRSLVFLDKNTLVSMNIAMQDVSFRLPISRQEEENGLVFANAFENYFPLFSKKAEFIDATDKPIEIKHIDISLTEQTPFGKMNHKIAAFEIKKWFQDNKVKRNSNILVTIQDWEKSIFRFEVESPKAYKQNYEEIKKTNQAFADFIFDMLESANDEKIYCHKTIPAAYACLKNSLKYPMDLWSTVLMKDPRMKSNGFSIEYIESQSFFEQVFYDDEPARFEKFSSEEGKQIYRFQIFLTYRKDIWRRIEIQGKQTLGDFDYILRKAFLHDTGGYFGGFWKQVRRGKGKKYRDIDLGRVSPSGEGSGADVPFAGLKLKKEDQLKYVFDSGDKVQHQIVLEEIHPPEKGKSYPLVIEQNKPNYKDCSSCSEGKKKKKRAIWFCNGCSREEQRAVILCESCREKEHEDHYVDEMLY